MKKPESFRIIYFTDKNAQTREALMMEVVLKDTEFAAHVRKVHIF